MSSLTSPRVIRRFIIVAAVATFVMFTFWAVVKQYVQVPPGDYEVRQGDILLGDKKFDEALERFNAALKKAPDHRGALMGRAIVFLQTSRYAEAEAEFTHLIDNLTATVAADDPTGIAVLAGAYANRGIMYDRMGQYEKALKDYVQALKTDEGAVEGPGVIEKILYSASPSTVRKRAIYLHQQLALPKEERLLRVPELDAQQRMYKP
jgi:tetratricopeptide (TPR) repeat protein